MNKVVNILFIYILFFGLISFNSGCTSCDELSRKKKNYHNIKRPVKTKTKIASVPRDTLITYIPVVQPKGNSERLPDNNYRIFLGDCSHNSEVLKAVCDVRNPVTRNFAVSLAREFEGNYNVRQIAAIYRKLRRDWRYVNDPRDGDYLAKASETIKEADLSGDCDDFAILMYSVIESIGGEARIVFASGSESGHAYVEVNVSSFNMHTVKHEIENLFPESRGVGLSMKEDNTGVWLNLDWSAEHPGGPYFSSVRENIFKFNTKTGEWECY